MKCGSTNYSEIVKEERYEPEYWITKQRINVVLQKYPHRKLEGYCNFIRKGIFDLNSSLYKEDGIPFLRISNLNYFDINTSSLVYIDNKQHEKNHKTALYNGDLALSKVGKYLGKILRIGKLYPQVNISQNIIGVSLKENENKNYIFAFMLSKFALMQINKAKKKQLQNKLNLPDIKKFDIVELPNNIMSDISHKIEYGASLSDNASILLKKAQQLFYTNIGIDFKSLKKENTFSVNKSDFFQADLWIPMYSYPIYVNTLKSIQEKWNTIPIGKITDLINGDEVGSDAYIEYLNKRKSDVPFVRTSDVVNYEIDQYPDFFIPEEIYKELGQEFQSGDVLFTKDGKIGMVGMITKSDKAIISSGFVGLRLNNKAAEYGITPEYLFLVLTIKEIGIYASKRRTVVASTIPHLREERLKEIEIPILDVEAISEITILVKEAFRLKDEKKRLITDVRETMDSNFSI